MIDLVRRPVRTRADSCPDGCRGLHSYTASSERWCWRPEGDGEFALDVELTTVAPPAAVARRLPPGVDFWEAWTRTEAIAKLTDTPVLTLLGRHGLQPPLPAGARAWHVRYGEAICCFVHRPSEES